MRFLADAATGGCRAFLGGKHNRIRAPASCHAPSGKLNRKDSKAQATGA